MVQRTQTKREKASPIAAIKLSTLGAPVLLLAPCVTSDLLHACKLYALSMSESMIPAATPF
jgi:hypothetical protein